MSLFPRIRFPRLPRKPQAGPRVAMQNASTMGMGAMDGGIRGSAAPGLMNHTGVNRALIARGRGHAVMHELHSH